MDDQQHHNQPPKLTLEEELDVLEAVWRVGKEKGLDLLRPEQKKKLVDGGRMRRQKGEEVLVEPEENQNDKNVERIVPLTDKQRKAVGNFYIAREVTTYLRAGLERDFPEFFKGVGTDDAEVKETMRDDVFRTVYGTSPQFFAYDLFNSLMGDKR